MVWAFRSEADARPVIQPEPPLLCLLLWDFQPFTPPDPRDALVVHMLAAVVQHSGDHAIAIAPKPAGQRDDVIGQPLLVWQATGDLAL